MRRQRPVPLLFALLAGALSAGCASPGLPDTSREFWPLVRETTEGGITDTRIGPFARVVRDEESTTVHALYPLFRSRRQPHRTQVDVRPLLHSVTAHRDDGTVARDWTFLPFLFGGTDPDEGDYFLFFPFGGNVRGLLAREETRFYMFPLYTELSARGYESKHVLWPLISWGSGAGKKDFRFLPFYAEKDVEGVRRYRSVMWPFVHWGEDRLNTDHPEETLFLFPFYGHRDSDVSWNRTILYPLIQYSGNEDGYRNTEVLWPVFRRTVTPEGRDLLRVWPLFGWDRNGERRSDYYLWPLIWSEEDRLPRGTTTSFRILPFVSRTRLYDLEGREAEAVDQLWPLFKNVRTGDGGRHFQMLAPVPFRGWDDLEASYGFLWSLVDHRQTPGGISDTGLLFGLVRHRTTPHEAYAGISLLIEYASDDENAKFHILKGLAGYETGAQGRAIRLLWLLRIPL